MSILAGVDALFDRHLHLADIGSSSPHYRHGKSARQLSAGRPTGFNARQLLDEAYAQLISNLDHSLRFERAGPSQENWRFEKQLSGSPVNPSPETRLERAFARAAGPEWANQVPTASGLWGSAIDRRRAVDLVWRHGDRSFNLIELKVRSDTPLFAAIEVIRYGLLYALARKRYPEAARTRQELLQANEVHLRVLAPGMYYQPFQLAWLERDLDAALRAFSVEQFGMPLLASFCFEAFPEGFREDAPDDALVQQLAQRHRVWLAEPAVSGS